MQVSPGKGKLGEGVGCEVADGRVGQELHHLQVSRKSEKGDYANFKEKRKYNCKMKEERLAYHADVLWRRVEHHRGEVHR